jgi:hypothetical protein
MQFPAGDSIRRSDAPLSGRFFFISFAMARWILDRPKEYSHSTELRVAERANVEC